MYSNAPILAVAFLSQLVAAQTTTSAPTPSGSSLPELVDQIDDCVLRCVSTYGSQLGCGATDFNCLCQSDPSRLSSAIAPCLFTSGCDLTVAQRTIPTPNPPTVKRPCTDTFSQRTLNSCLPCAAPPTTPPPPKSPQPPPSSWLPHRRPAAPVTTTTTTHPTTSRTAPTVCWLLWPHSSWHRRARASPAFFLVTFHTTPIDSRLPALLFWDGKRPVHTRLRVRTGR